VPQLAARGGGRVPRIAGRGQVEAEMERVDRLGARYLFLGQGLTRRCSPRSSPRRRR
jgi:DNA processing protein